MKFLIFPVLTSVAALIALTSCQQEAGDETTRPATATPAPTIAESLGLKLLTAKEAGAAYVEAWTKSGVGELELREQLNNQSCMTSADEFSFCVRSAISAFGSLASNLILAPETYWSTSPYNVVQIEASFGPLQLARVVSKKGKSDKSMKQLSDRIERDFAVYDREIKKQYTPPAITNSPAVNFTNVADVLLKISRELRGKDWDAITFATYFSKLLESRDSHSSIIPKSLTEWLNAQKRSDHVASGIESVYVDGIILVKRVRVGSAEFKAGLRQGDRIVKVNDLDLKSLNAESINEAFGKAFRESNDDGVSVEILDKSGRRLALKIRSAEVAEPDVILARTDFKYRDKFYRVLKLRTFWNEQACQLVANDGLAATPDGASEISGYILDLRDNLGGYLSASECVASLFLEEGKSLGHLRFFDPALERPIPSWKLTSHPMSARPLVVLVNGSSASGSEFVAMALRDNDRATIVGQLTYGKGSLNLPSDWGKSNQFNLFKTGGIFYGPAGLTNNRVGLIPDFVVPWRTGEKPDEEFAQRSMTLAANATKPENPPVAPRALERNRSLKKCIDIKAIADRERQLFGSDEGSDLQVLWASEILHCLQPTGN